MSSRQLILRLERRPGEPDRITLPGPRRLFLVRGLDGAIIWRSERPVACWRRYFARRQRDVKAVVRFLDPLGLRLHVAGEWDRAVELVEGRIAA